MISAASAIEHARALRPRLAERAARCEALRRCPDESIADLYETGLMQVMQPKQYGGSELGLDVIAAISFELSAACPSTAWVWLNLATHSWNIGQFGRAAQDDVWAQDPTALAATGLAFPCGKAVAVDGGYRVTGRWPFGSGVDGANWMLVGAMVERPGAAPDRRLMLIPQADYRSLDNWHAYGLTGTGSHDVEVRDVFVPEHRTVAPELLAAGTSAPGALISDAPIYRLPAFTAFGFCLASVPLGAARAALDDFLGSTRKRVGTYGAGRLAELGPVQARVAEASACVDFAMTVYHADLAELNRLAAEGVTVDPSTKLRWKRNLSFAVMLCKRAIDSLLAASGAGGLSTLHPMQRHFRDISAAATHIGLTWDVQASMYGKHALGVPPDANMLV